MFKSDTNQAKRTHQALNIVTKWRTLFTGWQLGTRQKGDPEGDAVRDHRELSILLRVEMTTLARLMIEKGLITLDEFNKALEEEAIELNKSYEQKFPGVTAHENGLTFDHRAAAWMKGWRP
jgi:hypothetical protein